MILHHACAPKQQNTQAGEALRDSNEGNPFGFTFQRLRNKRFYIGVAQCCAHVALSRLSLVIAQTEVHLRHVLIILASHANASIEHEFTLVSVRGDENGGPI